MRTALTPAELENVALYDERCEREPLTYAEIRAADARDRAVLWARLSDEERFRLEAKRARVRRNNRKYTERNANVLAARRAANRERLRMGNKAYYEKNRAKRLAYQREYGYRKRAERKAVTT